MFMEMDNSSAQFTQDLVHLPLVEPRHFQLCQELESMFAGYLKLIQQDTRSPVHVVTLPLGGYRSHLLSLFLVLEIASSKV